MKIYQSMFGVDWSDCEWNSLTELDKKTEPNGSTMGTVDDLERIDSVKQRCTSQNESLSLW